MTKVTIIGEATPIEKKKPIQFVKSIGSLGISNSISHPYVWKNIELICKNYDGGFDLMFAYSYKREGGVAHLGYFNDGIVEEEVGND